jgi:putative lipoprotein (rSAM/lipoprotein system)
MTRISKIYRILITALLALLGFSCGNSRIEESPVEYGTPRATYKAKGVVVSEADESFHIEGIQTVLKGDAFHWTPPAAYTNSDGSFSLSGNGFPMSNQKLYVQLIDVDGEENGGLFAEMEVEADYKDVPFTGGDGHWYSGQAEVDLGTIKMKPDNKNQTE